MQNISARRTSGTYIYHCWKSTITGVRFGWRVTLSRNTLQILLPHSPCYWFFYSCYLYASPAADILDQDVIIDWLTDDENREIKGAIEEVNSLSLDIVLARTSLIAVLFTSKPGMWSSLYLFHIVTKVWPIPSPCFVFVLDFIPAYCLLL